MRIVFIRSTFIRFNCPDGAVDKASDSVAVDFGFASESDQTYDLNIDIHSFSLIDVRH